MKFSLRTLFAFTFLVALALLAWRMFQDSRRDESRLQLLNAEIKSLEARVRLDDPAIHRVILSKVDELEPLHAMRERAVTHFDVLQEKYSGVEERGSDVLSIRGLPALRRHDEPVRVLFRMIVPRQRSVWLKFGVHQVERNVNSSRGSDQEDDLLSESPFDVSGPFEMQLQPGDQTLSVFAGEAKDGSLPVEIALNDKLLFRSCFESPDVTGTGLIHISAPSQIDFDSRRDLPWLLSTNINVESEGPDTERELAYAFSIWLSDHSSDFKGFPGK
ncbi:MAG: hypothetical protein H6821_09795 [Planctomycetaceae bacterium]|nr:hypothetical protein [Planctomycetales bacterium]MCB9874455.1 hypothetical protein [Planctomycetaceae bacterium]MCB9940968.1 hypothetical protein [Planctomycetaceae bacterium]